MQTAKSPGDVVAMGRARWGLGRRVAFRFVFIYTILYCFPFPLTLLPPLKFIGKQWDELLFQAAAPVGKTLFALEVIHQPTGSGDTALAFARSPRKNARRTAPSATARRRSRSTASTRWTPSSSTVARCRRRSTRPTGCAASGSRAA